MKRAKGIDTTYIKAGFESLKHYAPARENSWYWHHAVFQSITRSGIFNDHLECIDAFSAHTGFKALERVNLIYDATTGNTYRTGLAGGCSIWIPVLRCRLHLPLWWAIQRLPSAMGAHKWLVSAYKGVFAWTELLLDVFPDPFGTIQILSMKIPYFGQCTHADDISHPAAALPEQLPSP